MNAFRRINSLFFSSVGAEVIGFDIERKIPFENNTFDLIFSNQVIMDIDNFEGLFEEVYRILNEGGIFYFSIVHPAFYDW